LAFDEFALCSKETSSLRNGRRLRLEGQATEIVLVPAIVDVMVNVAELALQGQWEPLNVRTVARRFVPSGG